MTDYSNRQTIRAKYRGEYRKDLREKLNAEAAIAEIGEIETTLKDKFETLTAPQVGALRAVIESKWRKVAKILPDLKAVEHEPGETAEELARDSLNVRIAELYAAAHSRIVRSGSEGITDAPESGQATH